jgi:hypothetical protein
MEKVVRDFGVSFGNHCCCFAHFARHLIASLRCSSYYSRRQILTAAVTYHNEELHLHLGRRFFDLFATALQKTKESSTAFKDCEKITKFTTQQIEEQALSMKAFYATGPSSASNSPHYEDDICEALRAIDQLMQYVRNLLQAKVPLRANAWKELRELVSSRSDGRIDSQTTPALLDIRVQELLDLTNQKLTDWVVGDEFTPHFYECEKRKHLRVLKVIKYEIWLVLVERRSRHDSLHSSSIAMQGMSCH